MQFHTEIPSNSNSIPNQEAQGTPAAERATAGQTPRVLVVDDDPDMTEQLRVLLTREGYEVHTETRAAPALERAKQQPFDAVITDLRLGAEDGLALCQSLVTHRPNLPVVVLTGHGSMDAAVGAIRAGAYDFITKPVDRAELKLTLERARKHHSLVEELQRLRDQQRLPEDTGIVGDSPAMRRVFELIERVAPTDASVLIEGESGTGKELAARAIHARSPRADGPFVALNCGAVAESLLESELFGHTKGAFTDARSDREGLFVQADGGTLFLDEIGEMPLEMQTKLLRVLQERRVRPVGGKREVAFDTRLLAATNKDLEKEVAEGRFREDLYYRIHVVTIHIPRLAERGNDILKLAQHFLERSARAQGRDVHGISTEAAAKLLEYDWPGNVRQLQNCMERAVTLTAFDKITVDDLPARMQEHQSDQPISDHLSVDHFMTLADLERRHLERALSLANGNKTRAAQMLGLDRRTLYRKLERYAEQDRQRGLHDTH